MRGGGESFIVATLAPIGGGRGRGTTARPSRLPTLSHMSTAPAATRTPLGPVAVVTVSGLVVALVAASLAGVLSPLVLDDPGPVVRWALPLMRVVSDLSSAATLGLLILAAFLVPERKTTERRVQASRLAAVTGVIWFVAAGLGVFLTFASLAGLGLGDPELGRQFLTFVWSLEVTRVLSISTGVALVVTAGALLARTRAAYAWLAALALAGIVIVALTGHSAGSASHEDAVNSLGVHLIGVTVWVGGLLAIALMQPRIGKDLGATVSRYSVLAGWSYAAVAVTGLQQAVIRLGSFSGIDSAYGAMIVAKTVIIVVLGVIGWQQRRRVIASIGQRDNAFARLVLVELALMAAAFGLGAVLGRTPPPVPDAELSPSAVLSITGFPDPGPMAAADWFSAWRPNWLMIAIAVLAVGLYVAGVMQLQRRGDAWPIHRTILWTLGWLMFVWATSGAPDIWGRVQFSVHMVMHMVIAMVVPLLLVPAAPLTLALRALPVTPGPHVGPARGHPPGRPLARDEGPRQPGRRCCPLLRQPRSLLLVAAVRAGADHALGPPAHAGPLLPHRLPLHVGAHRHRSGAAEVVAGDPAAHPLRDDLLPRVLRGRPHRHAVRPGARLLRADQPPVGAAARSPTRSEPARSPGASVRRRR